MINVADAIDRHPMGFVQIRIVILCMVAALFDGFDIQTMALANPRISAELHMSHSLSGIVLSASLLGIMLGIIAFGMLGDRFGRRPIVISAVVAMGFLSLLTAATNGALQLIIVRIATGMAIGACLPNVIALASETVPRKWIGRYVILTYSSIPFGGVIAGYWAPIIMARHGWRSLFILGGILPLLLGGLDFAWLNESVQYLAHRGADPERIRRLLFKMFPAIQIAKGKSFTVSTVTKQHGVAALFADGNALLTLTIWVMFFLNLLCLYSLTLWLPTLFTERHWSAAEALRSSAVFQLGGIVGAQIGGLISEKIGRIRVLFGTFLLAGVLVVGLGQLNGSFAVMMGLLAMAGFMVIGSEQCLAGYTAAAYRTGARATGIGWALGVGRIGAILGPSAVGFGLSAGLDQRSLFAIIAVPTFIGCLLIPVLRVGEKISHAGEDAFVSDHA